jgi:hypothetical protein
MIPSVAQRKRLLHLHRLRTFLEKHLKRLRKPPTVVVAPLPPPPPTPPPNDSNPFAFQSEEDSTIRSDAVSGSSRVTCEAFNEFDLKKNELIDRCERKIGELGRLCRNLSHYKKTSNRLLSLSRGAPRQANERELRRRELIRKLIATEAEERNVLLAIGAKGRELRRVLVNDNTTPATLTRVTSSGEKLDAR